MADIFDQIEKEQQASKPSVIQPPEPIPSDTPIIVCGALIAVLAVYLAVRFARHFKLKSQQVAAILIIIPALVYGGYCFRYAHWQVKNLKEYRTVIAPAWEPPPSTDGPAVMIYSALAVRLIPSGFAAIVAWLLLMKKRHVPQSP